MPYDKQIRIYVYHSLAMTPIPIRPSFKHFNSVVDIYEDHEKVLSLQISILHVVIHMSITWQWAK